MTDTLYDLDDLYALLSRAYVTRDDEEPWSLADCHRWLVAASGGRDNGYPVVDEATVRKAFPEAFRPRRARARAVAAEHADELPVYIPSAHLARAVGWPSWRMLRHMRRLGIVRTGAGHPYVRREELSARAPELLGVFAAWFAANKNRRNARMRHHVAQ